MYRSATRSTPSFLRCRHSHLSGFIWDRLLFREHSVQYHEQGTLLLSGCHFFQTQIDYALQSGPKTLIFKHLRQLENASLKYKDNVAVRLPNQIVRFLSGNCDERENVDEKQVSSTGAGEECKAEEVAQPPHEATSTLETGQGLNLQEQVPLAKESQEQQPSQEKLSEQEKKKGDQRLQSLKTKFKRKLAERLQSLKTKFKRKLAKRLISWERINDSFDAFPYYISEHTRDLLIDCAAARLWHYKQRKFGRALRSSSHLILLEGPPGTEIYQEKLVRALAQYLQTSLLVLDSDLLAAQNYREEVQFSESESGDDEDSEAWSLGSVDDIDEDEEENSNRKRVQRAKSAVEELKRVLEFNETELGITSVKLVNGADKRKQEQWQQEAVKIGDHVKYTGNKGVKAAKKRTNLRAGQEGVVTSVSEAFPLKVGVKFDVGSKRGGANSRKHNGLVIMCDVKDLEKADIKCSEGEPWLAPMKALSEVIASSAGMIVYFPDIQHWMAGAVPPDERSLFLHRVGELLSRVNGPAVFITGKIKEDASTNDGPWNAMRNLFSSMRSSTLKRYKAHLKDEKEGTEEVFEIFKNVVPILLPQEQEQLRQWREQLEQDKKAILLRNNVKQIDKVLSENTMTCAEVAKLDTCDLNLTKKKAQKVVGWARNICLNDGVIKQKGRKLCLPRESLEKALSRLRVLEDSTSDKSTDIKALVENGYEKELVSSVVRAKDIGISFDQIGALGDVKDTLKELIILPLKRPELFKKGNLRKPCKGVLLFGPPGTGKTLLAKAVATECGANFMSINTSNITSKWFGDAEKLAKAVFTLARKLAPAIIFIDEVDSIFRARGDASEHEASRRVRNELMAAWDGLQSKESERILVLATTNRPFDLDDAVIRRLPRRIFVDLPDIENRAKILRVLLAEEDLGEDFNYSELASQTDGYSGSDLKNLCVAAAYRPIQEFLEAEKQAKVGGLVGGAAQPNHFHISVRPLCLEDFIQAKIKIGMSTAYDATSMIQMRQWNEQYGEGGSRTKTVFGFTK